MSARTSRPGARPATIGCSRMATRALQKAAPLRCLPLALSQALDGISSKQWASRTPQAAAEPFRLSGPRRPALGRSSGEEAFATLRPTAFVAPVSPRQESLSTRGARSCFDSVQKESAVTSRRNQPLPNPYRVMTVRPRRNDDLSSRVVIPPMPI